MSEATNGRDDGEPGFLPVIPDSLGIDPLLAALIHLTAFLDFSDDDTIASDAANEALEHVELYVQRLSEDRLDEIQSQLEKLEAYATQEGWSEDLVEFIRDFLYNCGLGEDDDSEA